MTHPADDLLENDDPFENNEPFSSPCSAPPVEPIDQEPAQVDVAPQPPEPASEKPASENIVPMTPLPQNPLPQVEALQRNFERQAEDSFRMAVGSTTETMSELYSATTEAYEGVSDAMRASAEGFTAAFTQLNLKLFEFARLNTQSGMDYMREVSSVRNMRDLVDVQTAYMRGQYDALTSQLRELQTLTTELTGKTAGPFKEQITRATQLPRIC